MLKLLAVVAVVSASAQAKAQRRDSAAILPTAETKLATPVQFGTVTVPARNYRVSLTPQGFSFIDAASLVALATVPVAGADTADTAPTATLEVTEKGNDVRIVMHYESHTYTAVGKKLSAKADAGGSQVKYDDLETKALPAPTGPSTPQALVEAALPRFEASIVNECAERAQRARWETDNAQFDKCVCPQVARWRVPKVTDELRLHRPLSKGRNGYSFTVGKDGHTKNCRVWSGSSAPADDTIAWRPVRKGAPTPAAATVSIKPTKNITPTDTTSGEKKHP